MGDDALRSFTRRLRLPLHRRHAFARLSRFHSRPRSLPEIVDAALDFETRGNMKVKAAQLRSEILALAEAVRDLKPRTILELGTARGGTLLVWAHLASERVITCDLEIPRYRHDLYRRYPPPGSRCRIELLEGDSHDPSFQARVRAALAGVPVDFLFIDGDHTEAGVSADWRDYRGLVRPGGLVAFHDIVENQPFESTQVHRLWSRICAENAGVTEEIVDDREQCGFGIGLVHLPTEARA
jgi:predicted O-methyltransferase YrrM